MQRAQSVFLRRQKPEFVSQDLIFILFPSFVVYPLCNLASFMDCIKIAGLGGVEYISYSYKKSDFEGL